MVRWRLLSRDRQSETESELRFTYVSLILPNHTVLHNNVLVVLEPVSPRSANPTNPHNTMKRGIDGPADPSRKSSENNDAGTCDLSTIFLTAITRESRNPAV
jgi:hypothetical protein